MVHPVLHAGCYPRNVLHLLLLQLGVRVQEAIMKLALKCCFEGLNSVAEEGVVDILETPGVRGGRVWGWVGRACVCVCLSRRVRE